MVNEYFDNIDCLVDDKFLVELLVCVCFIVASRERGEDGENTHTHTHTHTHTWRKGPDIKPEVKNTVKEKEVLDVNKHICVI